MANQTVYPYGTDGQLPSSVGIINDLYTGGSDKALSAEMGKNLNEQFNNFQTINLSQYTEVNVYINNTSNKWVVSTGYTGIFIAVSPGDKFVIQANEDNTSNYAILQNNTYANNTTPSFVTGGARVNISAGIYEEITIPEDGHYIYICTHTNVDVTPQSVKKALGIINDFIINDLDTGGADKALSAEQGKQIKFMLTGEIIVDPSDSAYEHYKDGYQLYARSSVIGLNIDNVGTQAQSGRTNIKIPIAGYNKVKFYEYNSTSGYGSLIIDADGTVLAAYTNSPGATITIPVPEDAAYLVYSSTNANIKITLYGDSVIPDVQNVDVNIIASGTLVGNGTTLVNYDFPISKGDYLHIDFPNGDWQTAEQSDTYAKVIVNLYKVDGSTETVARGYDLSKIGWTVPNYGFDFYASPRITQSYNTGRLGIRAASGTSVPFVIRRLSKEISKPYFADEIADSIDKIKAVQPSASLTFAVITDMHYRSVRVNSAPPFAPYSPLAAILSIKTLATLVRVDNVVCLGDGIDGRGYAIKAKEDASDLSEFFSFVGTPLIFAVGNHDDNRYYSSESGDRILNQGEIYANFVQQVDERTSLGGAMGGCNYYRDIERHKIRCVVVMSIDFSGNYSFTSSTRTWLTSTLDSMPEGYKALVFVHVPPPASHNWSTEGAHTGGEATATILANNADKIICVFDGHLHLDNVYVKPYISVNMCCQKVYNSPSGQNNPGSSAPEGAWWPIREAGTKNELLWDAVVINQEDGLLSCIRVGAGVDRYIHYNPIEVEAGGTTTLTPAAITATSWAILESESSSISIADGVVTVDASATVGSRLMAKAVDADGNFEYWCIKVIANS